jgi:hypothetical protein
VPEERRYDDRVHTYTVSYSKYNGNFNSPIVHSPIYFAVAYNDDMKEIGRGHTTSN